MKSKAIARQVLRKEVGSEGFKLKNSLTQSLRSIYSKRQSAQRERERERKGEHY